MILLTARSDEESKLLGTTIGADSFLGKPFNEKELVGQVKNLLRLKQREREIDELNQHLTHNVLRRTLAPDLVDDILAGRASIHDTPTSRSVTVVFATLVGFARTAALLPGDEAASVLNEHLGRMTDVVYEHKGSIDKFIGGTIMLLFGAPVELAPRDQVSRAVACARAMQRAAEELDRQRVARGLSSMPLRVGIHYGPAVVGNFGGALRADYTAVGSTVNLAARLESRCEPGQILVSGELVDYLPEGTARETGSLRLKGFSREVPCFVIQS